VVWIPRANRSGSSPEGTTRTLDSPDPKDKLWRLLRVSLIMLEAPLLKLLTCLEGEYSALPDLVAAELLQAQLQVRPGGRGEQG